jgi:hypothetical protein
LLRFEAAADVGHEAVGDGAHLVLRIALRIPLQRLDVETFVKARIGDAPADAARITDKAKLPAFPRSDLAPSKSRSTNWKNADG